MLWIVQPVCFLLCLVLYCNPLWTRTVSCLISLLFVLLCFDSLFHFFHYAVFGTLSWRLFGSYRRLVVCTGPKNRTAVEIR
ncbi:hypothetical protein JB92DRAFT_1927788 [Gautieria morchelliformis]|nr:hypothetical protein JB92DRAFT_1927788 [Gautieria morchelliformis]